ncbi:unnamed protein product, partial [Penicillium egyptiacum]
MHDPKQTTSPRPSKVNAETRQVEKEMEEREERQREQASAGESARPSNWPSAPATWLELPELTSRTCSLPSTTGQSSTRVSCSREA